MSRFVRPETPTYGEWINQNALPQAKDRNSGPVAIELQFGKNACTSSLAKIGEKVRKLSDK